MGLYSDSEFSVPALLDELHSKEIASLSGVGTWGSAAQRHAVATTTRNTRFKMGVQEASGDANDNTDDSLPAAVKRLAESVAQGGTDIDAEFCRQVQAEGVTEGAYVEVVSVAARIVNLDVFARGIGVPVRQFPPPQDAQAPSFERPEEAIDEGFFTATIPNGPAGGKTGESLFGGQPAGNILRTLSLVPEEARNVIGLVQTQYYDNSTFMDFSAQRHHALTRAQMEVVATKVSAHHQCFY